MSRTAIIVLAQAPVAGLAKTRLIPARGAAGAGALAERMLGHRGGMAGAAEPDTLEACAAPDTRHSAFVRLAESHQVRLTTPGEPRDPRHLPPGWWP